MVYYIFLKNYESLYVIKTNTYNNEVQEILKWYFGDYYDIILVLENPKDIFSKPYVFKAKEEILEELEWKSSGYYFEEEGEELDLKILYLKSILV